MRTPRHDRAPIGALLAREVLAQLHSRDISGTGVAALTDWDYQTELHASAVQALEFLQRCHRSLGLLGFRRVLLAARRVVLALKEMRHHLLASPPFGSVEKGTELWIRGLRVRAVLAPCARPRIGFGCFAEQMLLELSRESGRAKLGGLTRKVGTIIEPDEAG